jgi:hypothetical protein
MHTVGACGVKRNLVSCIRHYSWIRHALKNFSSKVVATTNTRTPSILGEHSFGSSICWTVSGTPGSPPATCPSHSRIRDGENS